MQRKATLLWLAVLLYASGIFLLSANPSPPSDGDLGLSILFFDKIAHSVIYFFFGMLLFRAIRETGTGNEWYVAYLLGTAYAFFDEIHQYFVPNRSTDYLDFLVDAAAMAVAIYICILREKHINER